MSSINIVVEQANNNYYKLSYCTALFHLIKSICNIGWFMLPYAFHNIDWSIAVATSIIIGLIAMYALHLLFENIFQLSIQTGLPYLGISEALREAFEMGPINLQNFSFEAEIFMDIIIIIHYMGIGCINVTFIAIVLKHIIEIYSIKIQLWFLEWLELFPFLLFTFCKHFYYLMGFTILFEFAKYIGLICFIFFICLHKFTMQKNIDDFNIQFPFIHLLGICLYTFCPMGVLLNIAADLRQPKHFTKWYGILNIGMLFIIGASIFIGIIGSASFDEKTNILIINNVPMDNIFCIIWLVICILAVFCNQFFCYYVIVDLIFYKYFIKYFQKENRPLYEHLSRIFIIFLLVALAAYLQYLEIIVCLVAYLTVTIFIFILPASMNMCLTWEKELNFTLIRNVLLMWFGIVLSSVGMTITLYDLWHR